MIEIQAPRLPADLNASPRQLIEQHFPSVGTVPISGDAAAVHEAGDYQKAFRLRRQSTEQGIASLQVFLGLRMLK